ncbi:unnamed protein product [Heterobilharzia americana]|nr:unnamed protein product [Heterobilharzia americana]
MKFKSTSVSYASKDPLTVETLRGAQETQLDGQPTKQESRNYKLSKETSPQQSTNQLMRKYSFPTPTQLEDGTDKKGSKSSDTSQKTEKMKEKKKFSFRKLIGRFDDSSKSRTGSNLSKSQSDEQIHRKSEQMLAELDLVHKLMNSPEEMGLDHEHGKDNETECYVQTICEPCSVSKAGINFDLLLRRIDTTNARVTTLINLCTTAVLASDTSAINFLVNSLKRMRRKQNLSINEADDMMSTFLKDPLVLLRSRKKGNRNEAGGGEEKAVTFSINYPEDDDEDEDEDEINGVSDETEIRWEMNSLHLSTDNSTSDSDDEGPTPEYVLNLSKQIRKTEGTRLKQNLRLLRHKKSSTTVIATGAGVAGGSSVPGSISKKASFNVPPPLNPLGHNRNDLLRAHATVPSGLCQQGRKISSSSMVSSTGGSCHTDGRQLSWLISEYLERGSSTYKWATELINSIVKMSVNRSTWLNVHQQLRETTELLYSHRDQLMKNPCSASETPQGEIAWTKLQAIHQAILLGDLNSSTITSDRGSTTTTTNNNDSDDNNSKTDRRLVQLSGLLEKKLHLAYLCDLLLWKAHKVILMDHGYDDEDIAKCQLMDFQIRLLELQLDQANGQNWSSALMDYIMCWMCEICEWKREFNPNTSDIDYFIWNEFQGDFRALDADRCSRSYAALIRQIQEHAMKNRPLSYFAERALYDIAVELGCPVNWDERFDSLSKELQYAWQEWELIIQEKIDRDF